MIWQCTLENIAKQPHARINTLYSHETFTMLPASFFTNVDHTSSGKGKCLRHAETRASIYGTRPSRGLRQNELRCCALCSRPKFKRGGFLVLDLQCVREKHIHGKMGCVDWHTSITTWVHTSRRESLAQLQRQTGNFLCL